MLTAQASTMYCWTADVREQHKRANKHVSVEEDTCPTDAVYRWICTMEWQRSSNTTNRSSLITKSA